MLFERSHLELGSQLLIQIFSVQQAVGFLHKLQVIYILQHYSFAGGVYLAVDRVLHVVVTKHIRTLYQRSSIIAAIDVFLPFHFPALCFMYAVRLTAGLNIDN